MAELINVAYPPMEPFREITSLPDIPGEEPKALSKREEAHLRAYEVAKDAHTEAYNRQKELYEITSCRLGGCSYLARAGLKFCRQHVGIRRQLPRAMYRQLGPSTKVKL